MTEPILKLEDLTLQYELGKSNLTAVSDASLSIGNGDYFGLVGESGCGKSTIARGIFRALDENGKIASGSIKYKGRDITNISDKKFRDEIRWNEISYIPQGSMNSLDPTLRIADQAWKIAKQNTELSKQEAMNRFAELLDIVGIQESRIDDYPHQFSGGMQQRVTIALALFLKPSLIIADEPTTALDVIMQDQIMKYIEEIQDTQEISLILITHDIAVVFETCNKLAVMHSGQIAEQGDIREIFEEPRHPYSILLQEAIPDYRHRDEELSIIEGSPPQTMGEIDYCTFSDRCPWAISDCTKGAPPLEPAKDGSEEHMVACIRKDEVHNEYAAKQKQ